MGEYCGENAGIGTQGMDDVSYLRPARYSGDSVYFVKKNGKFLHICNFFRIFARKFVSTEYSVC